MLVLSLAFGPEVQQEDSLNHVIVLNFLAFLISRSVREALVAAEEEIREVNLILAFLGVDYLSIVENLKSETPVDTLILQVSAILLKTNVQAGHGCVSRGNEDLLFENDTVLGR